MRDDRGQALVFTVLILGLAAAAIVGLRDAQERILDRVRDDRAGEAAVSAAGVVVADAMFDETGGWRRHPTQAETAALVGRPSTVDAARAAAVALARANGRADPSEVSLHAFGYEIEVHVTLAGRRHIALLEPPP